MPNLRKINNMAGLLQEKKMEGQNITWLEMLRQQGRDSFANNGIPSPKTEAWKYTKLRGLNVDDFELIVIHENIVQIGDGCFDNCKGEIINKSKVSFHLK